MAAEKPSRMLLPCFPPSPMPDDAGFIAALDFVLAKEGGYSDDPADPGGATNFGISLRFYRAEIDSLASSQTIKGLSRDQAAAIYRKRFWEMPGCDKMPGCVAFLVFDCAVNQGRGRAISFLQRALGMNAAKIDGIYGPDTAAALQKADIAALLDEIAARRGEAYAGSVIFRTFGLGWMRRLMQAHARAIHILNQSGE